MSKKHRKRERTDAVSKPQYPITANSVDQAVKNIQRQHARMMAQLLQHQDRRQHHPEGRMRPAKLISGTRIPPHKVQTTKKIKVLRGPGGRPMKSGRVRLATLSPRIKFALPHKTAICIRRKIREEVLHALRRTGKGANRRKPHRNRFSGVSCK
nr:MAG: hypothetical protein [Microvirus sp.]